MSGAAVADVEEGGEAARRRMKCGGEGRRPRSLSYAESIDVLFSPSVHRCHSLLTHWHNRLAGPGRQ